MSILDYNPYNDKPFRKVQEDTLLWLEANWDKNRVFVITAPTSAGKTLLAITISNWVRSKNLQTAIITPNNILLEQYQTEFPSTPSLMGQDHYMCKHNKGLSCADVQDLEDHKCSDCKYLKSKKDCDESSLAFFNYHSYYAFNKNKPVLIADEAHNLYPFIQELSSITLWDFKHGTSDVNDIASFKNRIKILEINAKLKYENAKDEDKKTKVALLRTWMRYEKIYQDLCYAPQDFSFAREQRLYEGNMMWCVSVKPLNLDKLHVRLWSGRTSKIVLLSATMQAEEVKMIGIERMGAVYYEVPSPIPVVNRKVYLQPIATMNKDNIEAGVQKMMGRIMEISNARPDVKGVIHTSYQIGKMIATMLRLEYKKDSRFMIYDQNSKREVLEEFINTDKPRILIGAGISEGLNLIGDLCRFQIITKVMYPYLGDPHTKNLQMKNSKYYSWMAVKHLIQSVGRSTRTETDFSENFILDEAFINLYTYNKELFPKWFTDAVEWDLGVKHG